MAPQESVAGRATGLLDWARNPRMRNLPARVWLLAALAIPSQVTACGLVSSGSSDVPIAGSPSSAGGSETDGSSPSGGTGATSAGGSLASRGGAAGEPGTVGGGGGSGSSGSAGAAGGTAGVDSGTAGAGTGGATDVPQEIVLFDGSALSFNNWISRSRPTDGGHNPWSNNGDGTMTVKSGTGDILSKQTFRNVFVHAEYMIPEFPISPGSGHDAGNSGLLLNGSYELQILAREVSDLQAAQLCGAVYGIQGPLAVACHEEGAWNTYEIEFQAPTCDVEDPTQVVAPGRFVEVKLNGTLIHRNVDVPQSTISGLAETCEPRGLLLQDWATIVPVSFRNIWAIPRN